MSEEQKPRLQFQLVPLQDVLEFFKKGFEFPPNLEVVEFEAVAVDTTRNVVCYRFLVKDKK